MIVNTASIEIARGVEEVFSFFIEPAKLMRWVGGLVESRPLTPGETRVGSKSRQVVVLAGQRLEIEVEIISFERGKKLEARAWGSALDAVSLHRFEEVEGRTRVVHRSDTTLRGAFRFVSPFVRGTMQKKLEADLASLKRLLENEAGAPSGAPAV